ncbi:exodeoxyribonuclease III [Megalodesulfovibrio paquesii]
MRLACWNVNGIRAAWGKGFGEWLSASTADIICLQETKVHPDQLGEAERQPPGWWSAWHWATKKKGYSGVACFARTPPLHWSMDLANELFHGEGRCLHLEYPAFHLLNIYFPNGQMNQERLDYKMGYYDAFLDHAQTLRKTKPVIVCGDFNTAHTELDIARPKENEKTSGFLPIERAWMDRFEAAGYVDTFRHLHPGEKDHYTWWSFRANARARNVGWRIDYFYVSSELTDAIEDAWIEPDIMGSDHCPIGLEINLSLA